MNQYTFREAVAHRRTCYALSAESPITEEELLDLLDTALRDAPSAFNVQSSRLVLLLGVAHRRLWDIVKEELLRLVPPEAATRTREKIDTAFAAGYGTVLFYEDRTLTERQKVTYPIYAYQIDNYSLQGSAMLQFIVWTLLADAGLGASLQHYNPLIDRRVAEEWDIDPAWKLIAQMPFGTPLTAPAPKEQHLAPESRRRVF